MSSRCVVSTTKITSTSVQTNLNSMFYWPCISTHLCNENQLDALFILSLFHQSTSTCFGHICSPSSGGILCIYNTHELYTRCPRRKGPNFGRVFLRSNYTDITQNTYIQSSMVTEISAREVWNLTAITHLLITKYILKLAGICGFCNVNICT